MQHQIPVDLILTLLQAELKNLRFVHSLENAGLHVHEQLADLSPVILSLLGFSEQEMDADLLNFYFEQLRTWSDVPADRFNRVSSLAAKDIYHTLLSLSSRKNQS